MTNTKYRANGTSYINLYIYKVNKESFPGVENPGSVRDGNHCAQNIQSDHYQSSAPHILLALDT